MELGYSSMCHAWHTGILAMVLRGTCEMPNLITGKLGTAQHHCGLEVQVEKEKDNVPWATRVHNKLRYVDRHKALGEAQLLI